MLNTKLAGVTLQKYALHLVRVICISMNYDVSNYKVFWKRGCLSSA